MSTRLITACLLAGVLVSGCGESGAGDGPEPDGTGVPELGACRVLTPEDVTEPSNTTKPVACEEEHTAQTFAVGSLPNSFDDADHDDERLGAFAYRTCSGKFMKFLGADESLVMRTVVSWAWFRPAEEAWEDGARWYRCDVVGGGEQSRDYVPFPETAEGLLLGRPDDTWMVCVSGPSVTDSLKIPCSEDHDWRAVTTIKLGEPADPYPGDRVVEVTTRDYCSDSVMAWLNYPVDFEFGYTWFHEAEWEAGNRRSVCWAKTSE